MQAYSNELRASALAALALGMSIRAVAKEYHVSRTAVRNWQIEASPPPPVRPENRADLGELIARYLRAGLETLEAHAIQARDPAWFAKQSAGDLAVFDGVLADKLVRVLTALEPGNHEPPTLDAAAPPTAPDW